MLYRLVSACSPHNHIVVSMRGESYFGPRLRALGVDVRTLGMPKGRLTIKGVWKLRNVMAETAPDIVQTWMYHADLVGGLVAYFLGKQPVVWNIRNSTLDREKSSFSARMVARLNGRISAWLPAAIACCSAHAMKVHVAVGYCSDKIRVIPNGYNVELFAPDIDASHRVRAEWNVGTQETLIGMVARWDAQKDHGNLLRSLHILRTRGLALRCALIGQGMHRGNAELAAMIDEYRLSEDVILAGPREEIASVMNALDLHVLSSAFGEAFPNVIAEAMACGIPCVATDVGDAALIVGDTGWIVPAKNADALACAIEVALSKLAGNRREMAISCRARIAQNFGLEKVVHEYQRLWEEVRGAALHATTAPLQ